MLAAYNTSCLFFVSGSSVNANALPSGVNRRIRSIGICPSRKCGQTLDGDVSMAIVALMGKRVIEKGKTGKT